MGKMLKYKPITDLRLLGYLDDCLEIFELLNIEVPQPILFQQANSTSWFGLACYLDNSITLSEYILKDPENKIKPVIIHELAHLAANDIDPGCGHKGAWKNLAMRLSNYTGYSITRTDSRKNHLDWATQKKTTQKVYRFRCSGCGKTVVYHKQTSFVKTFNEKMKDGSPRWWCSYCDKNFHKHVGFIKEIN